jgi:restriction system protein
MKYVKEFSFWIFMIIVGYLFGFFKLVWVLTIGEPLLMGITALILITVIGFIKGVTKRNRKEQEEWEQKLRNSGIREVDNMTGEVFEDYLRSLLKARGYNVSLTSTSGDYGADLILSIGSTRIVVQAKRYSCSVGIRAVQEIVAAKNYYDANEYWVITNKYFTTSALNLAQSNNVVLIDRDQLIEWMIEDKQGA